MSDGCSPPSAGLYDPSTEHDSCGVGFVAHVKGEKSRAIVEDALEVLRRLAHRAACGADPETGDGAGILLQIPHRFFKAEGLRLGFDMPRRRRYGCSQGGGEADCRAPRRRRRPGFGRPLDQRTRRPLSLIAGAGCRAR